MWFLFILLSSLFALFDDARSCFWSAGLVGFCVCMFSIGRSLVAWLGVSTFYTSTKLVFKHVWEHCVASFALFKGLLLNKHGQIGLRSVLNWRVFYWECLPLLHVKSVTDFMWSNYCSTIEVQTVDPLRKTTLFLQNGLNLELSPSMLGAVGDLEVSSLPFLWVSWLARVFSWNLRLWSSTHCSTYFDNTEMKFYTSQVWMQFMELHIMKPEKLRTSARVWTCNLVMLVGCAYQLSYKITHAGSNSVQNW